mmetsp:Transcript_34792/g.74086  ORF Transcript_34792/g.74086 Transcript_34792/m.74086 type:complete len:145 (+) Transcript_34792:95-529(+)
MEEVPFTPSAASPPSEGALAENTSSVSCASIGLVLPRRIKRGVADQRRRRFGDIHFFGTREPSSLVPSSPNVVAASTLIASPLYAAARRAQSIGGKYVRGSFIYIAAARERRRRRPRRWSSSLRQFDEARGHAKHDRFRGVSGS